jgi:aspartyl-tRNA(Asn)/glutamyl-tRNA(Gln) amidotransferase subunit B
MGGFTTYIGLEIHIHLLTRTKAFCSCRAAYGDPPNTNICPVCLGYPGVLPAVNIRALEMAYTVASALRCELSRHTVFERKNYFYPDMPKNYQISQFTDPIGRGGRFAFETGSGEKQVRIHDVHLEEDAGKMIHTPQMSMLDFNRAGTSLLEIVTEPDLSDGREAEEFLKAFRRLVRSLGVCDGSMEEGSLRCDANISVNHAGAGLGTKVEIKNLNSFRFVRKAMDYEQRRQMKMIRTGARVVQETRLWDEERSRSSSMRSKEAAHDYRYFPEPDLPPFIPDEQFLSRCAAAAGELPLERKQRLADSFGLSEELADFLTEEKYRADFFEQCITYQAPPQTAAKWLKGDITGQLARRNLELDASPLTPVRAAALLGMLDQGILHAQSARQVLELVLDRDMDPQTLAEMEGLTGSDDEQMLLSVIDQVLSNHQGAAAQAADGSDKAVGFLMGQVLKASEGSPDPKHVRRLLCERIRCS